jgi:hypothetical protein
MSEVGGKLDATSQRRVPPSGERPKAQRLQVSDHPTGRKVVAGYTLPNGRVYSFVAALRDADPAH